MTASIVGDWGGIMATLSRLRPNCGAGAVLIVNLKLKRSRGVWSIFVSRFPSIGVLRDGGRDAGGAGTVVVEELQ